MRPLCDFIFPTHPVFVFLASADKMDGYDTIALGCPVIGSEELEETELAQITYAVRELHREKIPYRAMTGSVYTFSSLFERRYSSGDC